MKNKITTLYENILTSLGFEVSNDGFIKSVIGEEKSPLVVDGKSAVLPTLHNLRNPAQKYIFHPLREDMVGGESKLIDALRKAIAIRVNVITTSIALDLLNIAASPTLQKALSADQSDLTIALGEVDDATVKKLSQLSVAMAKKDPFRSFVGLYSRRGGLVNGKNYKRICVVFFPLYEELLKNEDKVFGVKVSNKQRETFLKLYRFIYPGIEEQDTFTSGSNSKIAPFFDSLIRSSVNLLSSLSDIMARFGNQLDISDYVKAEFDWFTEFDNIDQLTKEILAIPSSGTATPIQEKEPETVVAPVQPVQSAVPASSSVIPVVQNTIPVVSLPTQPQEGNSLRALLNRNPHTAAVANMNIGGPFVQPQLTNYRQPPGWMTPGSPMAPGKPVTQLMPWEGPSQFPNSAGW